MNNTIFPFCIAESMRRLLRAAGSVGVNIELLPPQVDRIKHKFLYREEMAFVNSQPASSSIALLTLLWSAKEAMFKWWSRI